MKAGWFVIVAGILLIIFRAPFVRETLGYNRWVWGFGFDEKLERWGRFLATMIGIGWIVVGAGLLLQN